MSKIAGGVFAVAIAALPYAGFSQPGPESADAVLDQIVDKIEREQQQNGQLSENLIGPLTELSLFYQENGDRALATAAIQRTLQVIRANRGLRALDQAPLIRLFIRNEEARGNVAGAWNLEQNLLALAKGHPDDLRAVPVLREIGDRRMGLLDRYLAGETPEEIYLGCYYQVVRVDEGSCNSGSRQVVVQGVLMDAWSSYLDAISVYVRNELYSSDELHEFEMGLLHSSYLYGNYGLGRASLQRLLRYDLVNSEPPLKQLQALVALADWDVLFGRVIPAHERYLDAYETFEGQDTASHAAIEQLLSPEQPIALPTFLPNPLATDAKDAVGFIDVAFDITWHGNAKRVEILDTSTAATNDATRRLVRLISWTRFRPRVVEGEIPQSSHVALRYYVSGEPDSLDDPSDEVRRRNIRHYRADMGLPRHFIETTSPPAPGSQPP